jgi:NADH-quinone oxidoreductase subunit L
VDHQILIAVLLLAPLVGFLANGLRFKSQNAVLAGAIATTAIGISFLCSVALVTKLIALDEVM